MRPRRPLRWLAATLLCALFVLLASAFQAAAARLDGPSGEGATPRLILPGERSVRPGQWIDVRWERADHVREMELLLSRDGGRTYACVTRELDPGTTHVLWRVPGDAGADLRLRIRFNRDGREIEAAPQPLHLAGVEGDAPEPLALPPIDAAAPARAAGDREAPARAGSGASAYEGSADAHEPAPPREVPTFSERRTANGAAWIAVRESARARGDRSPATVPLRP